MLYKKRGAFFVHIPGVGHLFPTHLLNNLFSLKNGQLHYVSHEKKMNHTLKKPRRKKKKK
jgi:hypothetical protein